MEAISHPFNILRPAKDNSNLPEDRPQKRRDLSSARRVKPETASIRKRNKSGIYIKRGDAFSSLLTTKGIIEWGKARKNAGKIQTKLKIFTASTYREAVLEILSAENGWQFSDRREDANYIHYRREKGTNYAFGHSHLVIKFGIKPRLIEFLALIFLLGSESYHSY